MSLWSPTHVQFTVLRARNLISKGKGGNNDVFVTIQLGKEKYQTSTIKNALNPEWFEECNLPIPHMGLQIEVCVFHRKALADDFLGYASIPLSEYKITESSKNSWVSLHNKPTKADGDKYRGELEVKLTFHCQSRPDIMSHWLKKKGPSIRNLTSAFGDKFKLTRSRSFRENRRGSETGQMDKCQAFDERGSNVSVEGPETLPGFYPYAHPQPQVHFSALDVSRSPWGVDYTNPETLTRSYSMSAAYIKSMSLDRGKVAHYSVSNNPSMNSTSINTKKIASPGIPESGSQFVYSLPVSRHKSEISFNQLPPSAYDLKLSAKDDTSVTFIRNNQGTPDQQFNSAARNSLPTNSVHFESTRRELSGIYESIKERTEPENSVSTSSDPESVPMPKPRGKKFKNALSVKNKHEIYMKENIGLVPFSSGRANSSDHQPFNGRDSGILDDRSSSLGNSLDGSIATTDGANNGSKTRGHSAATDGIVDRPRLEIPVGSTAGDRGILYQLDREMSLNGSVRSKKKVAPPSLFYSKENKYGELIVRKRSRGQRDRDRNRLLQIKQNGPGLYDDSASELSDSSRTDVPDDLMSVFKNMTKEELLRVVITSKAQMIRKDQYIKDLENYIDDLLVRVMETTPRLLTRQPFQRL